MAAVAVAVWRVRNGKSLMSVGVWLGVIGWALVWGVWVVRHQQPIPRWRLALWSGVMWSSGTPTPIPAGGGWRYGRVGDAGVVTVADRRCG